MKYEGGVKMIPSPPEIAVFKNPSPLLELRKINVILILISLVCIVYIGLIYHQARVMKLMWIFFLLLDRYHALQNIFNIAITVHNFHVDLPYSVIL